MDHVAERKRDMTPRRGISQTRIELVREGIGKKHSVPVTVELARVGIIKSEL